MKISEIAKLINGKIECNEASVENEVFSAFSSDMMSDVLAFVRDQGILVTGLVNPQTVRTAMMVDIGCIILVRGKRPDDGLISLASQNGIVVITTDLNMFETSGILYSAGIKA